MVGNARSAHKELFELAYTLEAEALEVTVNLIIAKGDGEGIDLLFFQWGTGQLVDEGKRELDEIFGEENITGFVWPYHEQADERIQMHLKNYGYKSVRRTGESGF